MLDAALPILSRDEDGFFAVLEEGTDNFGNNNNGRGVVEAVRADEAIGVALDYVETERPNTCDYKRTTPVESKRLTLSRSRGNVGTVPVNPTRGAHAIEVPLDGRDGRSTEPFITGPDDGNRFPYGIAYAGSPTLAPTLSPAAGQFRVAAEHPATPPSTG